MKLSILQKIEKNRVIVDLEREIMQAARAAWVESESTKEFLLNAKLPGWAKIYYSFNPYVLGTKIFRSVIDEIVSRFGILSIWAKAVPDDHRPRIAYEAAIKGSLNTSAYQSVVRASLDVGENAYRFVVGSRVYFPQYVNACYSIRYAVEALNSARHHECKDAFIAVQSLTNRCGWIVGYSESETIILSAIQHCIK